MVSRSGSPKSEAPMTSHAALHLYFLRQGPNPTISKRNTLNRFVEISICAKRMRQVIAKQAADSKFVQIGAIATEHNQQVLQQLHLSLQFLFNSNTLLIYQRNMVTFSCASVSKWWSTISKHMASMAHFVASACGTCPTTPQRPGTSSSADTKSQ